MLARLLESTTRGARIAALVAVGVVLGVVLAASALTGNPTSFVTVADGAPSASPSASATHGKSAEHSKAPKSDKSDKSDKTDKTSGQAESEIPDPEDSNGAGGSGGVHGSCVAAVAQDHSKVGGPHHNHGWVVSRAAHTCPDPQPSGSASD
ncbi:MAG TPA: hypothetical protein VH857_08715 [Actinomycetes bacterium]|nr:hypothetical protein [Actinomycetes bacterium]